MDRGQLKEARPTSAQSIFATRPRRPEATSKPKSESADYACPDPLDCANRTAKTMAASMRSVYRCHGYSPAFRMAARASRADIRDDPPATQSFPRFFPGCGSAREIRFRPPDQVLAARVFRDDERQAVGQRLLLHQRAPLDIDGSTSTSQLCISSSTSR